MKDLRAGFLLLAFCTSFQRGEGRNGHVRSGWGQIRFWLPFAVFLTCIIAHCKLHLPVRFCGRPLVHSRHLLKAKA